MRQRLLSSFLPPSPGTWIIVHCVYVVMYSVRVHSSPSCRLSSQIKWSQYCSCRQEALTWFNCGRSIWQERWRQVRYSSEKLDRYGTMRQELRRAEERKKPHSFDFYYSIPLGLFYFCITIVTVLWLIYKLNLYHKYVCIGKAQYVVCARLAVIYLWF